MSNVRKYRLFGRISVLDVLIVIACVALVYGGYLFAVPRQVDGATGRPIRFTLELLDRPEGFYAEIEEGIVIVDSVLDMDLGHVVRTYSQPLWRETSDLETQIIRRSFIEGREITYVVIETIADVCDFETVVNQVRIAVNRQISVRSRDFSGGGFITHLEFLD